VLPAGRIALASIAAVAVAVTQTAQLRAGADLAFALTDLAVGVAFVLGGLVAWRLVPDAPIGTASMLGAIAWQLGTLAMVTGDGAPSFVFFALSGYHDVAVAFLVLAYPTGLLARTPARALLSVLAAGYIVGSAFRLLTFQPAAWGCADCPRNPFAVTDSAWLFETSQDWVGRLLGVGVLAVAVVVAVRWIRGSVPARRAAGALPVAAAVWAALYVQDTWLRPVDELFVGDPAAFYVLAAARAAVPLSVAAGLISMRMRQTRLADLLIGVGESRRGAQLEPMLRSVLGDPELEIWWWDPETRSFHRSADPGDRRSSVDPGRHQVTTPLRRNGHLLALLCHDASVLDDARFSGAIAAAVGLIADHERLGAQVREQLVEVRASRTRILEAAAAERARLERDLHDSSQQRLVGLALQLRMARQIVDSDAAPELAAALDVAAKELAEALAELRELARGIHPAALTDGGLRAAVPMLADRCPIPVVIDIELGTRPNSMVESTLYFVVSEALANVAKHAGATSVTVSVREADGRVELRVADDGAGGADVRGGTGLRGLRDRVETLGGDMAVSSPPGGGTVLVAAVPSDPAGGD
jgi:signal transduction histidine kinase